MKFVYESDVAVQRMNVNKYPISVTGFYPKALIVTKQRVEVLLEYM